MKNYLLILFVFLASSSIAKDKSRPKHTHKNTIKLYGNNFVYPEIGTAKQNLNKIRETLVTMATATIDNTGLQQLGIGYEREIAKRWGAGVTYFQWNNTGVFNPNGQGQPLTIPFNNYKIGIGLLDRYSQKYVDFSSNYHIVNSKKHKLSVGLALSYQSGYSTYIDSIFYYNNPSFLHYQLYGHYEYHEFIGYAPSLSYDFIFLKDHACIGTDLRVRRYFNYGNYTQIDFGMHIGIRFGDPHFRKKDAKHTSL